MSIKLPMPVMGTDTDETVQILFDTVLKLRKELDYALQHLDDENIPDLPDMKTEITNGTSAIQVNADNIQINSDNIELKVDADGVIAAIRVSTEGVKIQGTKVDLVGAVTVLSDITGELGTITAGTIRGVTYTNPSETGSFIIDQYGESDLADFKFYGSWVNPMVELYDGTDYLAFRSDDTNVFRYSRSAEKTFMDGVWDYGSSEVANQDYACKDETTQGIGLKVNGTSLEVYLDGVLEGSVTLT